MIWVSNIYLDLASKYAAYAASAIIAVSEATKRDLVKKDRLSPKRVLVAHEGVETTFFRLKSKKDLSLLTYHL